MITAPPPVEVSPVGWSHVPAVDTALGPLSALLSDPEVTEVLVSGTDVIRVERAGRLVETGVRFASPGAVREAVGRLLQGTGRRVDDGHPLVEAALAGGLRLHAALPPVAAGGPHLTLRRPSQQHRSLADLVRGGALPPAATAFLHAAVLGRRSILVTGAAGTGKTTLLAALAALAPADERLVLLEDTAELVIEHPHVARLECRPALPEGGGAVLLPDLVRAALRMRPDRIVVGEVRGAEAAEMIQAMATGHDGSMATLHAGAVDEAVERLTALIALAWPSQPDARLRRWIGSAVDVVVHCSRQPDGTRVVDEVAALEVEGGDLVSAVIFASQGEGGLLPTGTLPRRCMARMRRAGTDFPCRLLEAG